MMLPAAAQRVTAARAAASSSMQDVQRGMLALQQAAAAVARAHEQLRRAKEEAAVVRQVLSEQGEAAAARQARLAKAAASQRQWDAKVAAEAEMLKRRGGSAAAGAAANGGASFPSLLELQAHDTDSFPAPAVAVSSATAADAMLFFASNPVSHGLDDRHSGSHMAADEMDTDAVADAVAPAGAGAEVVADVEYVEEDEEDEGTAHNLVALELALHEIASEEGLAAAGDAGGAVGAGAGAAAMGAGGASGGAGGDAAQAAAAARAEVIARMEARARAAARDLARIRARAKAGAGAKGGKAKRDHRSGTMATKLHGELSHSLTTYMTRRLTESFVDFLIPALHDAIAPHMRARLDALPSRVAGTVHAAVSRSVLMGVASLVDRTLPSFVTQASTDILIRALTESVPRAVVATVAEALLHPPELVACCDECKRSGGAAPCACCTSTPADNAAVAVDIVNRIVPHYARYYGNATAGAFNARFTAALASDAVGKPDPVQWPGP